MARTRAVSKKIAPTASQKVKRRAAAPKPANRFDKLILNIHGKKHHLVGNRAYGENARCFIPETRKDGVYHVVDTQYKAKDRKEISRNVPEILESSRLLTEAELNAVEYMDMGHHVAHFKECDEGRHFFGMCMGPRDMAKLKLIEKMGRLREIVHTPGFRTKLVRLQNKTKNGKKTCEYNILASVQHSASETTVRIQLGSHARESDELFEEFSKLSTEVAVAVVEECVPEETKAILRRQSKKNGALCYGVCYNPYTNAIQLNLTPADEDSTGSLSDSDRLANAGVLHIDQHDDPTRYSVMLFLGHFGPKTFPGRFIFTGTKITCTCEPFGAVIFQGVDAHRGLGEGLYPSDLPLDSPLRYKSPSDLDLPSLPEGTPYARANSVVYPSKELMMYRNWMLNAEFEEEAGLAQFGDKASQMEWKMQRHIRKLAEETPAQPLPTADDIVKMFGWLDLKTNETAYPSVDVAAECLSYDRKRDPAFEKLQRIKEKTQASLNEVKVIKAAAVVERKNKILADRKENYKLRDEGKPLKPRVIPPRLTEEEKKVPGPPQSIDPTVWTYQGYARGFDPAVDKVAGSYN